MNDLINRQAALDAIEIKPFDDYGDYMRARELIEDLPSVQPARPRGKWIEVQRYKFTDKMAINECSICYDTIWTYDGDRRWNYCPNCGANMREEQTDVGT